MIQTRNKGLMSALHVTITSLNHALSGREDVLVTTSFGFQSALLFFLLKEADVDAQFLYISSPLAFGGIERQRELISDLFHVEVCEVSRSEWVAGELGASEFMNLSSARRKTICSDLKRGPLMDFSRENKIKVWVTGIRRDQTRSRASVQFINGTDLGMVKVAPIYSWGSSEVESLLRYCKLPVNTEYVDLCKYNDTFECGLHG